LVRGRLRLARALAYYYDAVLVLDYVGGYDDTLPRPKAARRVLLCFALLF
jgi:hypothetical protein